MSSRPAQHRRRTDRRRALDPPRRITPASDAARVDGVRLPVAEPLEPRLLMSAADTAPELCDATPPPVEHGAGCGCPGCQTIVDTFGELTVASAITDDDGNLLINPDHLDAAGYEFDALTVLPDVESGAEAAEGSDGADDTEVAAALTGLPSLHSKSGASATLYLDFDGHFESSWGSWSNLTTPAYDTDGDVTSLSSSEISRITEIWARVAEDYAPFDIDVTTVAPSSFANQVALRVVIGGSSSDWYGGGAGGVSYINSFSNSIANVAYVFENQLGNGNAKYVAEAASHEAGHAFGLRHQAEWNGSTKVADYWAGANGWAPVMGVGYYQEQTTWHDGMNSSGAMQDDMAVLAGSTNGFGYRADDHGSTSGSATTVAIAAGGSFSSSGIIGRNTDTDVFKFSVGAGSFGVTLSVAQYGPNLDAVLELYNSSGSLVASANPATLGASISTNLAAGDYYLHVKNDGQYGSVGKYALSGSAVPGAGGGGQQQSAPEVTVTYTGGSITDGQIAAVSFGSVGQGAAGPTLTFTVRNDGNATLTTASLAVPTGYSVIDGLSASIAAGSTDTFTVRLDSAAVGTKSGSITFTTNDDDESAFNFAVTGSVASPGDITVLYNGSNIADGSAAAISFGSAGHGAAAPTRTFTVRNDGSATLTISSVSVPTGFTLVEGVASTLAAGSSDTFTVRLNTTSVGSYSGDIRIYSDDSDEATFNFAVAGSVTIVSDAYENNDSKAQADAAAEGEAGSPNLGLLFERLVIDDLSMDDASDWFRFEMGGDGVIGDFVRADFSHAAGDLDVIVYGADGVTEIGRSDGTGNSETVSLAGQTGGVYYVRVLGYNGSTNPDYSLTIDPAASESVFVAGHAVQYTDADGAVVTLTIKGAGAGQITFDSDGNASAISITGSDHRTAVTITSTGDSSVGDFVVAGSIGRIDARSIRIVGDIGIGGSLGTLTAAAVDAAAQQTLTIGTGEYTGGATIQIGSVRNLDINCAGAIRTLQVDAWIDSDANADVISTTTLRSLQSTGDFEAGLDLSGDGASAYTLTTAKIGGALSGDWAVHGGSLKSLTAASTDAGFSLAVDAGIGTLRTLGDLAGSLAAATIRTVKAGGDIHGDLALAGDAAQRYTLRTVSATGQIGGGHWTIAGDVGTIRAASTAAGFDLDATGAVGSVRLTGDIGGSLAAASFKSIQAGGNLTASITASGSDLAGVSISQIRAATADGAVIVADGGIKTLKIGQWLGESISAAWVSSISVAGDFMADLTLTGDPDQAYTLGNVRVGGSLGDATWLIEGDIRSLRAAAAGEQFTLGVTGQVSSLLIADDASGASASAAPAAEPASSAVPDRLLLGSMLDEFVRRAADDLDALFHADPADDASPAARRAPLWHTLRRTMHVV